MPSQHITALKLGQPCDSDEPAPKRRAISSADCGSFRSLLEGYHYHELHSDSELLSDVCTNEDAPNTSTSSSLSSNVVANTPNGSFDDGMSMDAVAIPSPQICYGMIVESNLGPLGPKKLWSMADTTAAFRLRIRADAVTLLLPSLSEEECGILDSKTAGVLTTLLRKNSGLYFEAFLDPDKRIDSDRRRQPPPVLPLTINIYGPEASLDSVSSVLSEAKVFLQEPTNLHPSSSYHNPHYLSWDEDAETPQFRQLSLSTAIGVAEIYEILDQPNLVQVSHELHQDSRIKTVLQSHQLEALQFMISRENECANAENRSLWQRQYRHDTDIYVHKITLEERPLRPEEARGGILADDMGTGKSLTLLAIILHTLDLARKTRAAQRQDSKAGWSGATLIISPKSTLPNWRSEIEKHISSDVVKVYTYHDTRKPVNSVFLEKFDVVLTTYETACLDHLKGGVLQNAKWFRVALDEAHQIRNRSTKTFQAINSLRAQRRWCLTGTPVQNRLEDVFSLTEFLRFYPVDNPLNTRQHILAPLGRKDHKILKDLQDIMSSIALRRSKITCESRSRVERVEVVVLSPEEREQYKKFLLEAKEKRTRRGRNTRAQVLLHAILKLRQLCSHGTLNPKTAVSSCKYISHCPQCGNPLPLFIPKTEAIQSVREDQEHRVCHDCTLSGNINTPTVDPQDQSIDDYIELSSGPVMSGTDIYQDSYLASACSNGFEVKNDNKSSKLEKVLSTLVDLHTELDNHGAPVKSLVFSCWTTTLTCLEYALDDRRIPFVCIYGSQSTTARETNIRRFSSEPDLRVMLLSTGCGSVGLNLTAASYVHIVEPQWNPMVEAQAAARVDRLDQTKNIIIIRYIVERSIEERIQARQKKKILNAEFSACQMSSGSQNTDLPNDLMDMEDLF